MTASVLFFVFAVAWAQNPPNNVLLPRSAQPVAPAPPAVSPLKSQLAEQFVAGTQFPVALDRSLTNVLQGGINSIPEFDLRAEVATRFLPKIPELKRQILNQQRMHYEQYFTEAELSEMVTFVRSSAGIKYFSAERIQKAGNAMAPAADSLQQVIREVRAEHEAKKEAPPPRSF